MNSKQIIDQFHSLSGTWNETAVEGRMERLADVLSGEEIRTLVSKVEALAKSDPWDDDQGATTSRFDGYEVEIARFVEGVWWSGEQEADADVNARRAWNGGLRSRAAWARWTIHRNLDGTKLDTALGSGRLRSDAQEQWLRILDKMYDDPWLLDRDPAEITDFVRDIARPFPSTDNEDKTELTERRLRVVDAVTSRHLLPRFDIAGAGQAVQNVHGWLAPATWLAGASMLALSVVFAGRANLAAAVLIALAAYAGVVVIAAAKGAMVLHPLCLRASAGAVLGAFALFAVDGWEQHVVGFDPSLHLGLMLAPLAYLLVEARQRQQQTGVAFGRAVVVYLAVTLQSAAVAVIAVGVAGPTFLSNGNVSLVEGNMSRTWLIQSWQSRMYLVMFVAGAAATAGTFLQVLWEDKSITAPLSRFTWGTR